MNWSMLWGSPENIIFFPMLVGVLVALIYRLHRWRTAVVLLIGQQRTQKMLHAGSLNKQLIKIFLVCTAVLFLLLALLRPQWHQKEISVSQEGRDLFIALDISRSMLATDCMPSRLACAKNKIEALVKQLSCERVGLILFSGSTFVQCPLTTDYAAFYMFLDQIDVETISSGTTALDQAIKQALRSFTSASGELKNKLLVLVTDGEDFSSNLSGVKQEAAKKNLSIFALGVGTQQGSPIALFDERGNQYGHQRDAQGAVVISRLNEDILRSLASDCGGHYLKVTDDDSDIHTLTSWVRKFEKEKYDDKKFSRFEAQYHYCALISFMCLALEWLL